MHNLFSIFTSNDVTHSLWQFANTYIFPTLYVIFAIATVVGAAYQLIKTQIDPENKYKHLKNVVWIFIIGTLFIVIIVLIQNVIVPPLLNP